MKTVGRTRNDGGCPTLFVMFSTASYLAKKYFAGRLRAIDHMSHAPIAVQQKVLRQLLHAARNTEWGQLYDYANISSYEKYAAHVPLQDYASLKKYFERMMLGERDVLWPGVMRWFAKSSGTTGEASKFIPVSREGLYASHIKTGKDFLSSYLRNFPASNFFTGRGLVIGGSCDVYAPYPHTQVGDVSAILMHNLPQWIQYFRTPNLEIALLKNWEEKLEAMVNAALTENITNLSGVPSWTMLLLQRVLEKTKAGSIAEVWPNLQLFAHGGVSLLPYRKTFDELFGKEIHYQNIYNASEGFFAFQDSLDNDAMLLHTDVGIYYEFIPFDDHFENNQAVSLGEVNLHTNYAMVISTNSGLWRYILGDTVEFTSLSPYRINITGRTQHHINAFGEEVTVSNTDKALAIACNKMNLQVVEYTVAPKFLTLQNSGQHEWLIEFEQPPEDIAGFEKLLDDTLQQLNSDYAAKRANHLLMQNLCVSVAEKGTFYQWQKAQGKLGAQQKIPRLKNDRNFIESLTFKKG